MYVTFSVSKKQLDAGTYQVPDSVQFDQVQITDVLGPVQVHLWLDNTIIKLINTITEENYQLPVLIVELCVTSSIVFTRLQQLAQIIRLFINVNIKQDYGQQNTWCWTAIFVSAVQWKWLQSHIVKLQTLQSAWKLISSIRTCVTATAHVHW